MEWAKCPYTASSPQIQRFPKSHMCFFFGKKFDPISKQKDDDYVGEDVHVTWTALGSGTGLVSAAAGTAYS